jgi:two-component system phosphate regulon sensor histidine kinase PhoR
MRDYLAVYQKLIDSIGEPQESQLTSVFQYINRNQNTNQTFVYSHGILEEDYNITSSLLESQSSDTTNIKDYKSLKTTTIIDDAFDREMQNMSSIERLQRVEKMSLIDRAKYESVFSDLAKLKPIDYRVFDGDLATKVGSDRYTNLEGIEKFSMPLFANNKGETNFSLVIGFPNRVSYLRSSISFLIILSIVFTLVIIISFVSTILSSIRQKNISEMKTDFINNMTHEFKTPIATIDLALNAVKNEKVKKDNTLVDKYLSIIKEENKRMNAQVENVLRISQLQKKQLIISKDRLKLHDLILDAITHIELIINDIILKSVASVKLLLDEKNGSIDLKLSENIIDFEFAFDEMINVFINILDNSIKYSKEEPKIHIESFMDLNLIKVKITDNGIGMSTKVKNKIFENFYRETKGNIHNVKGHGLGLSYVKKIVDLHGGTISVSSDLNKGTSFTLSFNV